MSKILLGSHVSFKSPNYLLDSCEESNSNNANAMMIFLGPPQSSRRVSHDKLKINDFLNSEKSKKFNQENIIVHAPYIINLAKKENEEFNISFLKKEMELMHKFKITKMVIHPGFKKDLDLYEALDQVVKVIKIIFLETNNITLSLETMSGKGTEICSKLEEIEYIIKKVNNPRLKICIDTCHIWDSGYDVLNNFDNFIQELKTKDLLDKIDIIHINDSKNSLSSHKDRHENIGKGYLGEKGILNFINSDVFKKCVFILETPWLDKKNSNYKKEINFILKNKR